MKKLIFILSLFLIFGCKSKKKTVEKNPEIASEEIVIKEENAVAKFEKVEKKSINSYQKNRAYDLGKRVLMTCNTSSFKPFSDKEAVQSVRDNTTEDRLTKTCLKFKLRYGDFIDLEFQDAYKEYLTDNMVYRFKALYSRKIANKELQVTLNTNNQITNLKSKDWEETFKN